MFPNLAEFLVAPVEQVAKAVPTTIIFAPGGTRRSAVLAGIPPHSEDYARWSRERMIECTRLFFHLGARHLFVSLLRPAQLAEVGRYRERVLDWLAWGLAGPDAMADYQRLGWRARLIGAEDIPALHAAAQQLQEATPARWTHTVWWYVSATPDAYWMALLEAAHRARAHTQAEAIRALYGEDIPLAKLCLSFGKPLIAVDMLPLLLADELQCYWTQRPGFMLDEPMLRQIIYDYAYLRSTWTQDKSSRYGEVLAQRSIWERPITLGLGRRVGGFWYPVLEEPEADDKSDL